jgi:hypothetical protein
MAAEVTAVTAWSAPQPLDKISLQICQLFAFPCYLQFIVPFVNNFQAVDFKEHQAIKIYEIDFEDLLHFLVQCADLLLNILEKAPPTDLCHKFSIGSVNLTFSYSLSTKKSTITITENQNEFKFEPSLVPKLISAVNKLLFKCYGYSNNINYLINQYVTLASTNLLKNPSYLEANAVFIQLDSVLVDYFLLYDIITRHKQVLIYLNKLSPFNEQ